MRVPLMALPVCRKPDLKSASLDASVSLHPNLLLLVRSECNNPVKNKLFCKPGMLISKTAVFPKLFSVTTPLSQPVSQMLNYSSFGSSLFWPILEVNTFKLYFSKQP